MKLLKLMTEQGVALIGCIERENGLVGGGRIVIPWDDLPDEVQQALTEAAQAEVEKE